MGGRGVGGFLFRLCRAISYDPAWLKPSLPGCHLVVRWLHCSRPIYRHAGMPKARPLMCLTLCELVPTMGRILYCWYQRACAYVQVSRSGFAPLVTVEWLVVGPSIIGAF
jgi:hypothetical protein